MIDRQAIGAAAEKIGIDFLKKNGYKIIERNFRTRFGEIDAIAEKGSYLVFVEVKCRRSGAFGLPAEAVDRRKQEHLTKSALSYLKLKGIVDRDVRFDVLSVGPGTGDVELIPDAFSASPRYTY